MGGGDGKLLLQIPRLKLLEYLFEERELLFHILWRDFHVEGEGRNRENLLACCLAVSLEVAEELMLPGKFGVPLHMVGTLGEKVETEALKVDLLGNGGPSEVEMRGSLVRKLLPIGAARFLEDSSD